MNNVQIRYFISTIYTHKTSLSIFQSIRKKYKVGYTMRDIRYKWNEGPNSVGVSEDVSLPQFKVLGHRQRAMEISLTTGRSQESFVGLPHLFLSKISNSNLFFNL